MKVLARPVLGAALAAALILGAAVPLLSPAEGLAGDEVTRVDLSGKNVVLLLAVAPGTKEYVEDLTGVVRKVDSTGVLLDCTGRTLIDDGSRSAGDYQHQLFVPWSSVLYVKILN